MKKLSERTAFFVHKDCLDKSDNDISCYRDSLKCHYRFDPVIFYSLSISIEHLPEGIGSVFFF